jgi:hypothetical protein
MKMSEQNQTCNLTSDIWEQISPKKYLLSKNKLAINGLK